jgi:hypothetical protein
MQPGTRQPPIGPASHPASGGAALAAAKALLGLLLVCAGAAVVPRIVCGRQAEALYAGTGDAQDDLGREVAAFACAPAAAAFRTGSSRFDGEWALVTQQMAVLGLGQIALAHPQRRVAYLPTIQGCVKRLLDPKMTAFGEEAWNEQGLRALESKNGHAYLGYVNLALGMLRLLDPGTRHAALHDRLTASLARRLQAAPHHFIETYPGETYPADVAMAVGSIGLYDQVLGQAAGQAAGTGHRALLRDFAASFRAVAVDPRSGLAYQRLDPSTGRATGAPRASGTALCVYAFSFADRELSRQLFDALAVGQRAALFGFGAVREYPPGHAGVGDIDSGPVLLGVSVSATGFALAGARLFEERGLFTELYRTADLFGVPVGGAYGRLFLSGGPLGNAILLAMLTATWQRGGA